jgi:hypothetical protein
MVRGRRLFYVHEVDQPESECPICFAVTRDPVAHKQWHLKHAQNLQALLDSVNRLKPPATSHRRA